MSKIPFTEMGRKHREFIDRLQAKTAEEVMDRRHATVREDATIEEAIGLMLEKGLRRIPVLDESCSYKGMLSRESLLRTGFGQV
ncbi:MAG: CBS domain-containing protein [Syntrophobacteraceae bacterium]|nr:CBS domain-containing protein [Desulfobacteraceae bacterium]